MATAGLQGASGSCSKKEKDVYTKLTIVIINNHDQATIDDLILWVEPCHRHTAWQSDCDQWGIEHAM